MAEIKGRAGATLEACGAVVVVPPLEDEGEVDAKVVGKGDLDVPGLAD